MYLSLINLSGFKMTDTYMIASSGFHMTEQSRSRCPAGTETSPRPAASHPKQQVRIQRPGSAAMGRWGWR